ncbi:MAG: NAD(P)/FAD-dependent oxidoreductase [Kiritimatiellia bacterium]
MLIVGAGPAGLLAAWAAARRRRPGGILAVDRMPEAGAKLAVAGGGRGNLSHLASEEEFAAAFGKRGRFTLPAFRSLPPEKLRAVLAEMGVPTVVDESQRIYPRSQSAAQVRDALFCACEKAGVRFVFGHRVEKVVPPRNSGDSWQVDSWTAHSVVLSAGGASAAHLGSDSSGFALATALGYDIAPPVPALVSLRLADTWPAAHSGLSLPDAGLSVAGARGRGLSVRGEILFTHRGISGPAVLNLSGRIARLLRDGQPVRLQLALIQDHPDFKRLRQTAGIRPVRAWLSERIPRALAGTLLDLAGIPPDQTFSRLSSAQEKNLLDHLAACPLTVSGTGGFKESMATAGGVSLKQVCPDTLEGRLTPRLHWAGEILDLDGPTGGWNLHWAFCSGHLAGSAAANAP